MKELGKILGFGHMSVNLRVFNIVLSLTMALFTFPSWACLFFVIFSLVVYTDRPKKSSR